jgi:predicted permease
MTVRGIFRRRRSEREQLRAEMQAHIAERADDLIEQGRTPRDARRRAAIEFGSVTQHVENSRRVWRSTIVERLADVAQDARRALRRLRSRPLASIGAVVTLGCAIAAAVGTWSVVDAVLLHPLALEDPSGLAALVMSSKESPSARLNLSYHQYVAIRDAAVFTSTAAGGAQSGVDVDVDGTARPRTACCVSYDYFDALGVRLPIGRTFSQEEDAEGVPLVAVLSYRFWASDFSADPHVVGRTVAIRKQKVVVIGVAPRAFRGLDLARVPDLYLPLHAIEAAGAGMINPLQKPGDSPSAWIGIVGRFKPGMSAADALARINAAVPSSVRAAWSLADLNTTALPAASRADITRFTRMLAGAVGLLLLIGCLAVGMLLLLQTEARRVEFAMCLALGATRWRLARSIALEGASLALAGAGLALPLTYLLFDSVRAFELPGRITLDGLDLGVDGRALAVAAIGAALATLVVAGQAGAFGFAANVADALRSRAGATPRVTGRRGRAVLVITQVAVATALVSGAGLFVRSLGQALELNAGYDTSRLVTGRVDPAGVDPPVRQAAPFFSDLRETLLVRPSIRSVAFTTDQGGMGPGGRLTIDDGQRRMPSFTLFLGVDDRYFRTIGLSMLDGRDFDRSDVDGAPLVGIVSASLARFIAADGRAVGHRIAEFWHRMGQPPNRVEIVGVVPDVITSVRALRPLVLYRPIAQVPAGPSLARNVVIRGNARASLVVRDVLDALRPVDSRVSTMTFRSLDDRLLEQLAPQQLSLRVFAALGVTSVVLALLGIAVLAESMAHVRRREMAIRAAMGATSAQLTGSMLGETLKLVCAGLGVGLALSWGAAGTIRSLLYRVEPLDPLTLSVVGAWMLILAVVVSLPTTIGVRRVDLLSVLRDE